MTIHLPFHFQELHQHSTRTPVREARSKAVLAHPAQAVLEHIAGTRRASMRIADASV